jgi:two-component system sensor histidine kinase KdpD
VLAQGCGGLRSAAAELQAQAALQRQQLQSTFLAAVSHDLRTPLATIVAAASSLQAQGERLGRDERERMLGSIVAQARHLGDITDNALELVRLAAGPHTLRREWQALEEIVGSVVARLRGDPCGARLEAAVEPALPLVRGRCDAAGAATGQPPRQRLPPRWRRAGAHRGNAARRRPSR